MAWTDTALWKRTLGNDTGSEAERSANEGLRKVYRDFRDHAKILAARIEADVPWIPGRGEPPRDAYIAVVDVDPIKAHIGTYEFTADQRLIADTETSLAALLQEVEKLVGGKAGGFPLCNAIGKRHVQAVD